MRVLGAGAASAAFAMALLGVSGADSAPSHPIAAPSSPAPVAAPAPVVASPTAARPVRHVPAPPKPEAVQLPPGPLGIPGAAYAAYQLAADRMALEAPACGIEWNLVAAVGRIESGHADGGNVDATGRTLTPIEGPLLDGTLPGNAVIPAGTGFARALGPMQFLPTTWALFGGDANGDGAADVNNLRDAAYGAARYLCSSASGLAAEPAQRIAVFAYNASVPYVDNVVAWSKAYRDRAIPVGGIPDMTAPVAPPSALPTPLPPARVVVVGCGRPDGAPLSRPGASSPPSVPPGSSPSSAVPSSTAPRSAVPGSSAPRSTGPSSPALRTTVPSSTARPGGSPRPSGPVAPASPPAAAVTTVVDCPSTAAAPSSQPAPSSRPAPSSSAARTPAPSARRPAPSSAPVTPAPPSPSVPVRPR